MEYRYKYPEILELNNTLYNEMRDKFIPTYFKHIKLLLKLKLNWSIFVSVIIIMVVQYTAPVLKWTRKEIKQRYHATGIAIDNACSPSI